MAGPLTGIRIVEIAAIGPVPFGVMLLADLGAEVVKVDRLAAARGQDINALGMNGMHRNRRSIAVDLKHPEGVEVVQRLAARADVVVEGFRPGVMERLGLGPDDLRDGHPELVYARTTGWGQDGPLADRAGHDIDYLAVAGALHAIGDPDRPPPPPLNYVADFGGGGTYLAMGVMAALLERASSGLGQVVDVAMVDGVAGLTAAFHGMFPIGGWRTERGTNMLDGTAPFYRCYETADGGFMAVGSVEPAFWMELLDRLDLSACGWAQWDKDAWPSMHARLEKVFASRTRDEWVELFEGSDACVAPVMDFLEAPNHPHNVARAAFLEVDGYQQPAPAPRFSRTPGEVRSGAPEFGGHTDEVLAELAYSPAEVADLREVEAVI